MAVWPSQLPPPFKGTFSESPAENTIRSSMDVGPAKVRRRTTANIRPISFTLRVPQELIDVLQEFYEDDTVSGALAFDYTHPRTGEAIQARFASVPSISHLEADVYSISISLEILP